MRLILNQTCSDQLTVALDTLHQAGIKTQGAATIGFDAAVLIDPDDAQKVFETLREIGISARAG